MGSLDDAPSKAPDDAEGDLERVNAMLAALKEGVGATVVGIFDDDRGRLHATSEPGPEPFWDAFRELRCLSVDWADSWYMELRSEKHVTAACSCGGHVLRSLLIHGRWALLVLVDRTLGSGDRG